jgi:hypothetical protein
MSLKTKRKKRERKEEHQNLEKKVTKQLKNTERQKGNTTKGKKRSTAPSQLPGRGLTDLQPQCELGKLGDRRQADPATG